MKESLQKLIENLPTENPYYPMYEDGTSILFEEDRLRHYSYIKDRYLPVEKIYHNPKSLRRLNEPDLLFIQNDLKGRQICPTYFTTTKSGKPKKTKAWMMLSEEEKEFHKRVVMNEVKRLVDERIKEINNARDEYYDKWPDIEETVHLFLVSLRALVTDFKNSTRKRSRRRFLRRAGSLFRSFIFDVPSVKTGLQTLEAFLKKGVDPKFKFTEEHYTPRTVGAFILFRMVLDDENISDSDLVAKMFEFCHILWCTADENERLIPFQKIHTFSTPAISYEEAGIVVVITPESYQIDIPWQWKALLYKYNVNIDYKVIKPDFNKVTSYETALRALEIHKS